MRFVESSVEFVPQEEGVEGMYKHMELSARTCYKTEDLIREGTAHKIIDNVIIPRGHTSVLEFGTVYLYRSFDSINSMSDEDKHFVDKYSRDRYSRVRYFASSMSIEWYITTTYRTILQGDYDDPIESIKNGFDKNWKDDLKYWSEPLEHHNKRYTYKFVMDRVGSQSVERHRGRFGFSYAQESTRYINYHRDKFDHQITCVLPAKFYDLIDEWSKSVDSLTGESFEWIKDATLEQKLNFLRCHDRGWVAYEDGLDNCGKEYMYLTGEEGWKPEDARGVLPLDVRTEFMMCGYPEDWEMFLFRRTDGHAHHQIQGIAKTLKEDFENRIK